MINYKINLMCKSENVIVHVLNVKKTISVKLKKTGSHLTKPVCQRKENIIHSETIHIPSSEHLNWYDKQSFIIMTIYKCLYNDENFRK